MPTFIVEIKETCTYRMRVEADSRDAAEVAVFEPLEEVSPAEVGAILTDAYIDSVRAREPYDWEQRGGGE